MTEKKMNKNRINELQNSRARSVKKLTKLLNTVVKTEWDIVTISQVLDDSVSRVAATQIANASSSIQSAISHLISTDTETHIAKNNKNVKESAEISTLKKAIKNNKLMS